MASARPDLNGFYWIWVRASARGWLLGLAAIIVLLLLGDLSGFLAESDSQWMVGVGIGWGVGHVQGRGLLPWLSASAPWTLSSTIGMGAPFVVHDVMVATGHELVFSVSLYVLVGALVTGVWQGALLRGVSGRAPWWVAGCLIGWTLPAACFAVADSATMGVVGDLASGVAVFLGGGMVGVGSGGILQWILRRPAT